MFVGVFGSNEGIMGMIGIIDGKDVVVTVHKDKDTSFSINTNGVSKQEILKFLLTQLNISVTLLSNCIGK